MKHTTTSEKTLLDTLGEFYPDSSKSTLRSWIKDGRVFLNEKVAERANDPVSPGQTLEIKRKTYSVTRKLAILYEDRDLVVIEKPAGMLTVATETEKEKTAHAFLKNHYYPKKVHVVHRLDKDTSGVMLFALSEKGCEKLKKIFEKHDIERAYCVIVEGVPQPQKGTWRSYLYEDENYFVHETKDPKKGRLAISHYECKATHRNYSCLHVKLETGRKNQIRVHCKKAGVPVAGDTKYGAKTNPLRRLGLHAYLLAFEHPFTKKKLRFEMAPPEQFLNFVKCKPKVFYA